MRNFLHLQSNNSVIKRRYIFLLLAFLTFASACSNKKNTGFSRFWHKLNTRFNGYFNGNEALKEGIYELGKTRKDNFSLIIPVHHYGAKDNWQNMNVQSDLALKKSIIMIQKHSMLINGKQHNKWIDDCYLLMGKANYFKQDYYVAASQLRYVADNSEKEYTRVEALIWILKVYNAQGELAEASSTLLQLKKRDIPKKLHEEFSAASADYYIQKQYYEQAVTSLEDAIKYAPRKRKKSRYQFIIGQIKQMNGEDKDAYDAFSKTLTMKPEYEIEFQSKINMARTSVDGNNENLKKLLTKMLRDDKNLDYLDQIYYALGMIDLKEDKREEAIAHFEKSLQSGGDNSIQKPLTYLVLAELYFKERQYEPSQAYYDSSSVLLSEDHPKYTEVLRFKQNLGELVTNIRMLNLQDSLQRLSKLSERELQNTLEDYIERLKIKDEEAKSNPGGGGGSGGSFVNPYQTQGVNSYWYNEQTKAFGANEFQKIWGTRPLEDDWRRSNKNSSSFPQTDPVAENDADNPRYQVETYLKDIPRTDSALAASDALIYEALYNIGVIYKEKIRDLAAGIATFLDLEKRNTTNRHFPLAYYQLYLSYNSLKDQQNADYYKNLLINNYPESDYAKLLSDPNYLANLERDKNAAEPFYRATYALYNAGAYDSTKSKCLVAQEEFTTSNILHRFALLYSLSVGKTDSVDQFIASLTDVKTKYAGTESAETAQRILDKLLKERKGTEGEKEPNNNSLIGENGQDTNSVSKKTEWDANLKVDHFVLIFIPDKAKNLADAKNQLSQFNDANYGTKGYTVTNAILGTYSILSVRKFASYEEALKYRETYMLQGMNEKLNLGTEVKVAVSNAKNFTTLFKTQDVSGYYEFFKSAYNVK